MIGYLLSSVCSPLGGGHCGVRVSVHLVCMGLHSVHLVGMGLGLGISGVKKSTRGVAFNKEQFNPTTSSPKNIHPSVRPSVNNFLENLIKKCHTFLSTLSSELLV